MGSTVNWKNICTRYKDKQLLSFFSPALPRGNADLTAVRSLDFSRDARHLIALLLSFGNFKKQNKKHCVRQHTGVRAKSLQLCLTLLWPPWTVPRQAPLSMGFSRQEYWSGLSRPAPGDLPDPGIEPTSLMSPALEADSLPLAPPGKPSYCVLINKSPIDLVRNVVILNTMFQVAHELFSSHCNWEMAWGS